jgi:hypothetical protein
MSTNPNAAANKLFRRQDTDAALADHQRAKIAQA